MAPGMVGCRHRSIEQADPPMSDAEFKTALIVGAGAGLSASLARALAQERIKVALAARSTADLDALAKEIGARRTAATHRSRPTWMRCSRRSMRRPARPTSSSTMRASARADRSSSSIPPTSSDRSPSLRSAAFLVAQQAARRMLPKRHGAILFTGASAGVKGYAQSAPFAMGKFALRGLAQSMARELHPQGIHVAHVVVDGGIKSERRHGARRPAREPARSRRDRCHVTCTSSTSRAAPGHGRSRCGRGWRNFSRSAQS